MKKRRPDPPSHVSDQQIADIARRYRRESVATLIAVCRDERAPASARATAASKLLEYSDGRPGQSRPIGVSDLQVMTPQQRSDLWEALIHYHVDDMPGGLQQLMHDAYEEECTKAVAAAIRQHIHGGRTAIFGFKRGDTAHQHIRTQSVPSSLPLGHPLTRYTPPQSTHERALEPAAGDLPDEASLPPPTSPPPTPPQPDNVVPIRQTNTGNVHPSVLERSAMSPAELRAYDHAFDEPYPWRF